MDIWKRKIKMFDQMKQARDVQKMMTQMKNEMAKIRIEGIAGGGAVTIIGDGNGDIIDIKLNKELLKNTDLETIENFLKSAFSDLKKKTEKEMKGQIKNNLGPLAGMFGI
jgi:nucleoid-associated protein EbfC